MYACMYVCMYVKDMFYFFLYLRFLCFGALESFSQLVNLVLHSQTRTIWIIVATGQSALPGHLITYTRGHRTSEYTSAIIEISIRIYMKMSIRIDM